MSFMEALPISAGAVGQESRGPDADPLTMDLDREIWGDEGAEDDLLSGLCGLPGNPAMRPVHRSAAAPAPKGQAMYEDLTHNDGLTFLLNRKAERQVMPKPAMPKPIMAFAASDMADELVFQGVKPATPKTVSAVAPPKPRGRGFFLRTGPGLAAR